MPLSEVPPMCSFCSRPVKIESAKTDENGKAVHEDCYVLRVTGKRHLPNLNSFFIVPQPQLSLRKKASPESSPHR